MPCIGLSHDECVYGRGEIGSRNYSEEQAGCWRGDLGLPAERNRTTVCRRHPWTASSCTDAVMFALGMSPEQEVRDVMQSHAGREALGEGGPWGSIGRYTGRQQLGLEDKGENDVVVNGRTSRGTEGGKGDMLKR